MRAIGARLSAQVHDAARELPPFGALVVRLDFVLADGILSRNDDRQVNVADIQRLTIEIFGSLVRERTTDLVVAPTEGVLAHRGGAGSTLRNRLTSNRDKAEQIPSVH